MHNVILTRLEYERKCAASLNTDKFYDKGISKRQENKSVKCIPL